MSSSAVNVFAILRSTSGAIFGTFSQYSPISHRMLARAMGTCSWGWHIRDKEQHLSQCYFRHNAPVITFTSSTIMNRTVMLSKSLAMCLMMSPCWVGWVWSSFLMTTMLSATTVSGEPKQVFTKLDRADISNDELKVQIWTQVTIQWGLFTVSIRKQQHQTVEACVRHLRDVGGAPADGLDGSCCERLILTLHVGLGKKKKKKKKDQMYSV